VAHDDHIGIHAGTLTALTALGSGA
jgi:hypothetical protein